MKKTACIICGKEKKGLAVNEDFVLETIRWFKTNVSKNVKGYSLVVCNECTNNYRKLRKKYTRRRALYVAIGVLFTIVLTVASNGRTIFAPLYGIGLTIILYLMSLLSYMPALKNESEETKTKDKKTKK